MRDRRRKTEERAPAQNLTQTQTGQTTLPGTDAIAAALDTVDPSETTLKLDTFEEALKMAQEAYDQQTEKGEAINEARIADSALR